MMVFYPPVYLICLGQGVGSFLLVWLHCALGVFACALGRELQVGRRQCSFMTASNSGSRALTAWMTGQMTTAGAVLCAGAVSFAPRTGARRAGESGGTPYCCAEFRASPEVFTFPPASIIGARLRRQALLLPGGAYANGTATSVRGSSPCVLPFVELAKEGNRVEASRAFTNFCKLEWPNFESLISPLGIWRGRGSISTKRSLFFGPIALLLGLAGLCRVRERNVRGLLTLLVVALLMALGDNTPFFWLFDKWLPGYSGLRIHSREVVLALLALICAGGIWLSRPHPLLHAIWSQSAGIPDRHVVIGAVLLHGLAWGTALGSSSV